MENWNTPATSGIAAKEYSGLEEIVKEFLGAHKVTAACFGVPGPVRDGRLRLTNLPWTLDSRELSASLGINHVFLINDLEANGYGVAELSADQIYTLSEGDASQIGNRALIAAGTGLGEALLIWNGRSHTPYPSEGGHADYAPRNEDEIDLLRFLKQKYNGRISYERVVSGMGLTNIYEFLREVRGMEEPAWLAERIAAEDPNAVITELALAAKSEICEKALDMFVSAYGAEAGNLALKLLSVGGVYVGGGIAPAHPRKAQGRHLHEGLHRQGPAQPVAHQHAGAHHSREPRRAAGRSRLRRSPRRRAQRHLAPRRLRQVLICKFRANTQGQPVPAGPSGFLKAAPSRASHRRSNGSHPIAFIRFSMAIRSSVSSGGLNPGTIAGWIPTKVDVRALAKVAAGLAKEVEALDVVLRNAVRSPFVWMLV